MNLRDVTMKYGRFVVLVRHDSAEILRLSMVLHLSLVL
jgi:ABC-type sulfate/molybdate transport systems ATPase subunit